MPNRGSSMRLRTAAICLGLLLPSVAGPHGTYGATIYSYVDDRGNPVYTDTLETIPQQYRAKVRTHERPDSKPPSMLESVQHNVQERAKQFDLTLPSLQLHFDGLNPGQSRILTYAGGAVVVLLAVIHLSKSQLVRLLGFCLLIAIGIGVPVLMYVSDGGPMDVMKQKAGAAGQAQQNRIEQTPR